MAESKTINSLYEEVLRQIGDHPEAAALWQEIHAAYVFTGEPDAGKVLSLLEKKRQEIAAE